MINLSGAVGVPTMSMEMEQVLKLWKIEESDSEFSLYDFDQIADATGNFSDDYKLGQGGFGAVYRVQYNSFLYTHTDLCIFCILYVCITE